MKTLQELFGKPFLAYTSAGRAPSILAHKLSIVIKLLHRENFLRCFERNGGVNLRWELLGSGFDTVETLWYSEKKWIGSTKATGGIFLAVKELGILTEVDIKTLWAHEQYDFSNWLADNLELLNTTIGLGSDIDSVRKECQVGAFRCDILYETAGETIIVENQLEPSDHDHLGKIITYASGLGASTIVWIVSEAREEHRSAIEWLNNSTREGINFFLIEIHAYRIGSSLAAPKFEIVEKPNDFVKSTKTQSEELTKSQSECLSFWLRFNERLEERGRPFPVRKATHHHWYNIAIGFSDCHISLRLVNKDGYIRVGLYIEDNKELFEALQSEKEKIETELSLPLDWQKLEGKKASLITYKIGGLSFDNHDNYPELIDEVIAKGALFASVFKKYVGDKS